MRKNNSRKYRLTVVMCVVLLAMALFAMGVMGAEAYAGGMRVDCMRGARGSSRCAAESACSACEACVQASRKREKITPERYPAE